MYSLIRNLEDAAKQLDTLAQAHGDKELNTIASRIRTELVGQSIADVQNTVRRLGQYKRRELG